MAQGWHINKMGLTIQTKTGTGCHTGLKTLPSKFDLFLLALRMINELVYFTYIKVRRQYGNYSYNALYMFRVKAGPANTWTNDAYERVR